MYVLIVVFFFQAEDGIRDLVRSRGLGDVYKRQGIEFVRLALIEALEENSKKIYEQSTDIKEVIGGLSLIHI